MHHNLSDEDFNQMLQNEFIIEAEELVESMEASLAKLEKSPADSHLLDETFRAAHTIKGSALAVKLDDLGHFTHKLEEALSKQQSNPQPIKTEIVKSLLAGTDLLSQFIEGLKHDRSFSISIESLQERLGKVDEAVTTKDAAPVSERERRVLVVEDDAGVRDVLIGEITELGYQVDEAPDGVDAIKMFAKGYRPDVIFTDLRMPNMDGNELVKTLHRATPEIPIVAYSGYAEKTDIINFLNAGAFAFIEKPIDSNILVSTLENALRERQRREKLEALTKLNFQAFMVVAKTSALIKDQGDDTIRTHVRKLEGMFQNLGTLLRDINQIR